MKIDTHVHCKPVSLCAHLYPESLVKCQKDGKVDAILLTNHYYPDHLNQFGHDFTNQLDEYFKCYNEAYKFGKEIGLKVLFGSEVRLINVTNTPEFLLFGFSENLMKKSFPLYTYTQKELFDYCNANDILMYQAHPFRTSQGYCPANTNYMHGVEVYNQHMFESFHLPKSLNMARKAKLLISAGGDFHYQNEAGNAGMIVPDEIETSFDLRDYLKKGEAILYDKNGIIDLSVV